ncbi:MAG: ABC-ATPase domain-containing protein [Myxococcales bacterium]|nr:ABC-ATPase domain-containing protein [Myxococcales bacterium]
MAGGDRGYRGGGHRGGGHRGGGYGGRDPQIPPDASLAEALRSLDGRGYPAYKALRDRDFPVDGATWRFVHVQGDPFASPSRLAIEVPSGRCPLEPVDLADADSRRAGADFLHRRLGRALERASQHAGSGKSGLLAMAKVSPQVLDRSGVVLRPDGSVRIVCWVGLPAGGRTIQGHGAARLLCEALPAALRDALDGLDEAALWAHVEAVEDQVDLRRALAERGLVAFVADGAVLPRRSGVDERPLPGAVPFKAPASLAVTLQTSHSGALRGLGIPQGVTVIVGGGYHGKSTLLAALAASVYDHVPGDGRERCVTRAEAISIRAEDGRAVRGVDLRPFIGALPGGRDTARFVTDDASGSTSQAAATVEAVEAGATALLIDEDTAATNFMIRDARMRALVPPGAEPITPFIDRVRQLHAEHGVSTVLVVGGAGDYLDVADTVLRMTDYVAHDATAAAAQVAQAFPLGDAAPKPPGPWPVGTPRQIEPASLSLPEGRGGKIKADRVRGLRYGDDEIDLSAVGQLVEAGQTRALGDLLRELSRQPGPQPMAALLAAARQALIQGLDPAHGDRARPRLLELACAISRFRGLRGSA